LPPHTWHDYRPLSFENFYQSGVRQGRQPPFWKMYFFQQFCKPWWGGVYSGGVSVVQRLQLLQVERTATHCNTHATDCNTLQHTASKLQHTATHCNYSGGISVAHGQQLLQVKHIATHRNTRVLWHHTYMYMIRGVFTCRSRSAVFTRKKSHKSMFWLSDLVDRVPTRQMRISHSFFEISTRHSKKRVCFASRRDSAREWIWYVTWQ